MTPIAPHITAFLRQRLPVERRASPHTCDTYAYAFQLLFEFASRTLGVPPSDLHVEQLDAPLVLAFLEYIQARRGNSPRTRNSRLASIRSFMRFLEHREPAALDQIRRVLAIPMQKTDIRLVEHLSDRESKAILDVPDPATRRGIRDRAMLHLMLAAGLRVSELVGLRTDELTFDGRYADLRIRGKGRRERALRLWKAVALSLRAWLAVRGPSSTPELFLNAWGRALTRSGFEHILRKHARVAGRRCSSLAKKRVSPHVLRHTCAFDTLHATRDIRKVALWLGHSSTRTADLYYLQADPTEKLEALAARTIPSLRPGRFSPPDRLIASLRGRSYAEHRGDRRGRTKPPARVRSA